MSITFITGNQDKADYLKQYLEFPLAHHALDLDEIQSLDVQAIAEHKARQAYGILHRPVLVEDVSLEFHALGRLPGPFIKWFLQELSNEAICALLQGKDRAATARAVFGFYDGQKMQLFESSLAGRIAETPAGNGGYGWDPLFIPEGYQVTSAELPIEDYEKFYTQVKPLAAVKRFLQDYHVR